MKNEENINESQLFMSTFPSLCPFMAVLFDGICDSRENVNVSVDQ